MGSIEHFETLPLRTTLEELREHTRITELEQDTSALYMTEDEAKDAIVDAWSQGRIIAVRCRQIDYDAIKPTATMLRIEDRIQRMREQCEKYTQEHSIHTLSAKLITCTQCDSRIAKEWIKGEHCPVCGNDLRSPYIPAQIETYNEKIKEMEREYNQARERLISKGLNSGAISPVVKWLVPCFDKE